MQVYGETEVIVARLLALREAWAKAGDAEARALGEAIAADRERCEREHERAIAEFDESMARRIAGYRPPRRRPFVYALDGVRVPTGEGA